MLSRRSRVWRALGLAGVSLGLAAHGCLLNRVEFDGPETQQGVNDLEGSGGSGGEASGNGGTGGGGAGSDGDAGNNLSAQGGTGATPADGAVGSVCAGDQGCTSLHCVEGLCVAATCNDEITNQDESDRDCGGPCFSRCEEGRACLANDDCAEALFCPAETRRCTPASCQDRVPNGGEILTDCGGGTCPGCPNGTACTEGTDCASGVCASATGSSDLFCIGSSCEDTNQNGAETDVDCGGLCPLPCEDTRGCVVPSDCINGNCVQNVCISCGDGVLNGFETGIDCGGIDPFCARCESGITCLLDSDCASNACQGGICCGGSQQHCTRCAERLSPGIDCNQIDDADAALCSSFLDCLQLFSATCTTRNSQGCSTAGGVCDHNAFGGDGSVALTRANQVLVNAGCQL